MDKRLYSLIQLLSPLEQEELYRLLKRMYLMRAEKYSQEMTADLMRELMKKERL